MKLLDKVAETRWFLASSSESEAIQQLFAKDRLQITALVHTSLR